MGDAVGVKRDEGKPRYELIPPCAIEGVAQVLTYGAKKYSDNNWRNGILYSRYFGACMRHLWAWWRGEDKDKETGYSHLYHAATCLFILAGMDDAGLTDWDDRHCWPDVREPE